MVQSSNITDISNNNNSNNSSSSSSSNNPNNNAIANIVERYLLAQTYDERYVHEYLCTSMIHPLVHELFITITRNIVLFGTKNTDSTESMSVVSSIVSEWFSWVLYVYVLSSKSTNTTTPGMELCQIQYTTNTTTTTTTTRRKLLSLLLSSSSTTIKLLFIPTLRTIIRLCSYVLQKQQQQQQDTAIGSGTTIQSSVILHNDNNTSTTTSSSIFNQLTGVSRQDIFYQQRQDMIRRSNTITNYNDSNNRINPIDAVTSTTTPTTLPISIQSQIPDYKNTDNDNRMNWKQRLCQIFQKVIVSLDVAIQSLPTIGPHHTTYTTSSSSSSSLLIPPTTNSLTTSTASSSSSISSPVLTHTIQYILQLYVAYYYIYGNRSSTSNFTIYPTLFHRIFRLHPQPQQHHTSTSSTVSGSSNKILSTIGVLMVFQLSWKLVLHGISQPTLYYIMRKYPYWKIFIRNRILSVVVKQLSFRSIDKSTTISPSKNKKKHRLVMKGNAPLSYSRPVPSSSIIRPDESEVDNTNNIRNNRNERHVLNDNTDNTPTTPTLMCSICRNTTIMNKVTTTNQNLPNDDIMTNEVMMLYPCCSIRCGHVYCWYCIQQWITYYGDNTCPICRIQCHPYHIQLLYNY